MLKRLLSVCSQEFREQVVKLVIDRSRAIIDVARECRVRDTTLGN
jgi:transposase-like protein